MTSDAHIPTDGVIMPATPWRAAPYSSVVGCGVVGLRGMLIATIPGPKKHAEPIARLIAAAPDLLALAKQYASECSECGGTGKCLDDSSCEDCADIRAVIAKAGPRV